MTEKPMIFNGEMIRAILEGRKTQTRRPMKPQPPADCGWNGWCVDTTGSRKRVGCAEFMDKNGDILSVKPRYQVGDLVWVKETWKKLPDGKIGYRASIDDTCRYGNFILIGGLWRPSIHMPRWASRITLEITGVRVERVQDISEDDAIAEGVGYGFQMNAGWPDYQHIDKNGICALTQDTAAISYSTLWDFIYGKTYPWDSNSWVFVYEFKRIKP